MVDERERGFTLIELMVVVLIIAVLIAIAIPTFLGARQRAQERAVQANLRNAFTAERLFYNKQSRYSDDPVQMTDEEGSILWTDVPLVGGAPSKQIYAEATNEGGTAQGIILAGRTKDGRCYYLRDVMNGLTAGTHYDADVQPNAPCTPPAGGWVDSW